jgi:hypothetical protein
MRPYSHAFLIPVDGYLDMSSQTVAFLVSQRRREDIVPLLVGFLVREAS